VKFPPKKSLGQHFLLNPTTIEKILKGASLKSTDRVLEIGPGPGAMTEGLVRGAAEVVAVEKDSRFAQALKEKYSDLPHFKIIEGDFLRLDLEKTLGLRGKWKVIANLPYNVATEILFRLFASRHLFDSFHLMVQFEVAKRLTASPGTKDYGILSVMSQLYSVNRIAMKLPPGAFTPPPKVHSAIVSFHLQPEPRFPVKNLPFFRSIVIASFGQRRKMIRNSLKAGLPHIPVEKLDAALAAAGIRPEDRAEMVSIDRLVRLANELI
jgi:16S rRNA (adenine1518-N6/adenine1519-N6)-dimethyltransferase